MNTDEFRIFVVFGPHIGTPSIASTRFNFFHSAASEFGTCSSAHVTKVEQGRIDGGRNACTEADSVRTANLEIERCAVLATWLVNEDIFASSPPSVGHTVNISGGYK